MLLFYPVRMQISIPEDAISCERLNLLLESSSPTAVPIVCCSGMNAGSFYPNFRPIRRLIPAMRAGILAGTGVPDGPPPAAVPFLCRKNISRKNNGPSGIPEGPDRCHCLAKQAIAYASSIGRYTAKLVPMPGVLFTVILPPQRSTMRFTSERPRPLPSVACALSP